MDTWNERAPKNCAGRPKTCLGFSSCPGLDLKEAKYEVENFMCSGTWSEEIIERCQSANAPACAAWAKMASASEPNDAHIDPWMSP